MIRPTTSRHNGQNTLHRLFSTTLQKQSWWYECPHPVRQISRCAIANISSRNSFLNPSDFPHQKVISLMISTGGEQNNAPIQIAQIFSVDLFIFLCKKPRYVVAFGGYSTFPVLLAAIITRTEIILHEQNAHLGKVNRIFAKYAKKIDRNISKEKGVIRVINRKPKEVSRFRKVKY